jgi:hypothetical protein
MDNVPLEITIDDRESQNLKFPGSDGWKHFNPLEFTISDLEPGKHILKITIPDDAPIKDEGSIQIRDIEIRSTKSAGEEETQKLETHFYPVSTPKKPQIETIYGYEIEFRAWNSDEQQNLFKLAEKASELVTLPLLMDDVDFRAFREMPAHDKLKKGLEQVISGEEGWNEYIYVARFADSATKYQVLCSTSEVIESGTLQDLDLNLMMQKALEYKKVVVTDLFSPNEGMVPGVAAVYYPFFSGDTPVGIMVTVKFYYRYVKKEKRKQGFLDSVKKLFP